MILRKPYAILIKYFKIIHILMFLSFGYLVFSLRKIYIFFANYIKTSNFTYVENMVDIYVPWILIIIVVVLLVLSISILLLMNKKEKPVLFYKIMICYCVFLLVILIYYMTFFRSLDNTLYDPLRIAVNRDIILFAYIFNFFFVAFTFIRGFGFDIKKFSFDRDKKELNLEESDSEEYELNVKIEKEDIKSFLNRHKRELKYYLKENKLILTIICVIIVVVGGVYIYYNKAVVNKEYTQDDYVTIGKLIYHVNSSRISNIDKYGEEFGEDNDYLIINLSITNNERNGHLDPEALRVHIDDEYYYPMSNCDLFNDMGNCYNNQELKTDADNNFILVYRIKKEHSDIFFEILKHKGDEYQYSKVKLSYTVDEIKEETIYDNEFRVGEYLYKIMNASLSDKVSYQYEECIDDKCTSYIKKLIPNTGTSILTIEFDNIGGLSNDFLNNSFGVSYYNKVYNGKDIELLDIHDNTVYYSLPIYVQSIDNVKLFVMVRPIKYNFILQGETNE